MPRCRIYLFTYKRHALLQRAIESLINQNFSSWVCEVHNDCPDDTFPEEYIISLNDRRFIIKNHSTNLGGTKSFNIAFLGCQEDYASILEDDNWWEPNFLEVMVDLMDQRPSLAIAWSNMRIWKESANGKWKYAGRTIWNNITSDTFFAWPSYQQAMGALHSNGAMIYRGNQASNYNIPSNCEFASIEPIRERSFAFPIYLVKEPLANFSQTLITHRSDKSWIWTSYQVMLLGSFISASKDQRNAFKELLLFYRKQSPSPVSNFFLVILFFIRKPKLFMYFRFCDWLIFIKWLTKNLFNIIRIQNYLKEQTNIYNFLLINTAKRYKDVS